MSNAAPTWGFDAEPVHQEDATVFSRGLGRWTALTRSTGRSQPLASPRPPIAFPGQRAIGTGLAWRCPQSGGWAESSGLGIEGGGRRVALAGMLLAVQLVPHPEVPSHLQVQPTVSAAVAASVAVAPLLDADGLVPAGTGRGQPLACREGQECLARCHHSHSQGAWFPRRSPNLKHLTPQASRKPQPTPKGRQF